MLRRGSAKAKEVKQWFFDSVTYEGERYVIDLEQAEAVVDESFNTIVTARAGSGKTRTIVAKVIYMVAKLDVKPEDILIFVFNSNAAKEINERLERMRVNGRAIIKNTKIASTFHAFSRKIVYEMYDGGHKCGKIMADEKERFLQAIVDEMLGNNMWRQKIARFIHEDEQERLEDEEIMTFSKMMANFVNRAQQGFLGGEVSFPDYVREYLNGNEIDERERVFVEIGMECFLRYHRYLLDEKFKNRFALKTGSDWILQYGTDFNLIVSWAGKVIRSGELRIRELLGEKKYVLIDEYQDFSQLFFSMVLAIREIIPEVKLFVVGDDLQAINRFAGSELKFFQDFEKYFEYDCRRLVISTNYRSDYEIVDKASRFVRRAMKEKGRIRSFRKRAGNVVIVEPKETELSFGLVDYDKRVQEEDRLYKEIAKRAARETPKKETVRYFKTIIEIVRQNSNSHDFMILHRNNLTELEGISLECLSEGLKWGLEKLGIMNGEEFDSSFRIMTMHKSKGLEAEVVIILEADEGVIPKMHPDTRLYGVFGETDEMALDDQKRLFYVAMTRAKRRLYIIHRREKGKGFVRL